VRTKKKRDYREEARKFSGRDHICPMCKKDFRNKEDSPTGCNHSVGQVKDWLIDRHYEQVAQEAWNSMEKKNNG
jgi:hypothetical protein